jgi:serine/threonine protein kinase
MAELYFNKAPELINGTSDTYSMQADVYALGMVSSACNQSSKPLRYVLWILDNPGKTF